VDVLEPGFEKVETTVSGEIEGGNGEEDDAVAVAVEADVSLGTGNVDGDVDVGGDCGIDVVEVVDELEMIVVSYLALTLWAVVDGKVVVANVVDLEGCVSSLGVVVVVDGAAVVKDSVVDVKPASVAFSLLSLDLVGRAVVVVVVDEVVCIFEATSLLGVEVGTGTGLVEVVAAVVVVVDVTTSVEVGLSEGNTVLVTVGGIVTFVVTSFTVVNEGSVVVGAEVEVEGGCGVVVVVVVVGLSVGSRIAAG